MKHRLILTLLTATLASPLHSFAGVKESCSSEKADLALLNKQSKLIEQQIKKLESDKNYKPETEVLSTLLEAQNNRETPGITLRIGKEKKVVNVGSSGTRGGQIGIYNEFLRKTKLDIINKEDKISRNECVSEPADCVSDLKNLDDKVCEVEEEFNSEKLTIKASQALNKETHKILNQDIEKLQKIMTNKSISGLSKVNVKIRPSVINLVALLPLSKTESQSGAKALALSNIAESVTHMNTTTPDLIVELNDSQIRQIVDVLVDYKNSLQLGTDSVKKVMLSEEVRGSAE